MPNLCTQLKSLALVFTLIVCTTSHTYSQYKPNFSEEIYASDVAGAVGLTFDKNGAMYVWGIDGRVTRIDPQTKQRSQLLDISGEIGRYDDFGLLSMVLDNNFLTNGRFYLYYVIKYASVKWQGTYARITRYEANPSDNYRSIKPNSRQILIGAPDPNNPSKGVPGDCIPLTSSSHAGGGLAMGADNSLLIPTGDGAAPSFDQGSYSESYFNQSIQNGFMTAAENIGSYRAQVDFSLSGKVLRINPENGDGLPGNPNFDSSNPRSVKSRIFASGLRQPFRTGLRPNTGSGDINAGNPGALYVGDVGFTDWEEINVIKKGANYGWPFYEGQYPSTRNYSKTEYKPASPTRPALAWRSGAGQINRNETLSNVNTTPANILPGYCAIGGNWHPGGGNYPAEYQNAYYFADFAGGWISKMSFDSDNQPQPETLVKLLDGGSTYQYITCVAFNPVDKNMYFIRYPEEGSEKVRRVVYNGASGGSPPVAIILSDKTNGASPLTVKFTGNTSYDPEGKTITYAWDFGDNTTSTSANPEHTFTTNSSTSTVYTVKLTVTDPDGKTNQTTKSITVSSASNTPPVIVSTSIDPLIQMDLDVIRNINLSAVITDETPSNQLSYKWTVSLFHNDHQHDDFITTTQTATASLPPIGCDGTLTFWYGVKLEVTDAGGLKTETIRYIYPNCPGTAQTITLNDIADRAPNAAAFTPVATASSGKPVIIYVIAGPAVVAEGKVFLTGRLGKVTIRAAQHGGDGYKPARPVEKSFNVVSDAADKQPPTTPTTLTLSSITQNSIRLTWNASTDNVSVASYEVYRNNTKIGDVNSGTTYNATGLSAGTEYFFFVRAVDPTGNVSANSNTATGTTTGTSTPPANAGPTAPTVAAMTATVNVSFTSNQLAPFTDPDGDALTYSLTGLPAGLSFNASNRVISGTPTQAGSYNLTYTATDNRNPAVNATFTLTVNSAGGNPTVTGNFEGYLDVVNCGSISGWVFNYDSPNAPYTVEFLAATGDNPPMSNAVVFGTTVASNFRQDLLNAGKGNGAHGYSFTVPNSIKTNQQQTIWGRIQGSTYVLMWSPKTLTCVGTGTPTNPPPAAPTVSPLSATINAAYTSAQLPAFTDVEALTYSMTGLPAGLNFNTSTRVISGTPTASGTFTLTYSAADSQNKTDLSITLVVATASTPTNPPPVKPSVSPLAATVNVAYTYTLPVFTDSEALTYTLTGLPAGLNFNASTRVISGTPTASGTFTLTYSAADSQNKSDLSVTLVVSAGGNPVVTGNFEGYLDGVNCSTFSGWVWDRDKPNTPITVEFLDGATVATATSIGAITADIYRVDLKNANKGNGAHGYLFTVPDNVKDNQTHTIWGRVQGSAFVLTWSPKTINCVGTGTPSNAAPVAPSVSPLSATINAGFTASALPVFTDAESDALTYTLTGLPNGVSFNASTRVISGTPTVDGTFTLTYSATDNKHSPVSTTLTLTVSTASAPQTGAYEGYLDVINCDGDIFGWVWDAYQPNTPLNIEIRDADNLIATITASLARPDLVSAQKGNGQHGYSYIIPATLKNGQNHSIGMRVQGSTYDLIGSPKTLNCPGNGNPLPEAPDNQPPTGPVLATQNRELGEATTYTIPEFTDPESETLTYALNGSVPGFTYSAATRTLSGTPTTLGTFTTSLIVTDPKGKTASALLTFVITDAAPPVNDPPVAPAVSPLSATVNVAFTASALPVFTDAESDALTYTLNGLPNGVSFNTSTRVISGTPTASGAFSLTYSATDSKHSPVSTTLTLTVSASNPPANVPPVAPSVSPLSATVNVAFTASALPVFTDTDPLTYSLTGLPNGLNFNTSTRVISGTPTQQGTFTLTYVANDGKTTEDVTFTLTVAAGGSTPPLAPAANYDGYLSKDVNCSSFSGWAWERAKGNNVVAIEFFEGASIAAGRSIGVVQANIFRQDLLTAGKGNGIHGFDYPIPDDIKDGQNHTIWGRVQGSEFVLKDSPKTINCAGSGTPSNAAPVAPAVSPLSATINVGFTASALPVFTDAESDALTYTLTGLPNGVSFNASTRVISGTPTVSGTFTLTYSATDNKHSPVSTTLTLTVNTAGGTPPPTNAAPVAPSVSPLSATINVGFTASTLPVFTDAESDALTYTLNGLPNGLSFNASTRVISGTPTVSGTFTLTYSATDNNHSPVSTTLTLTVNTAGGNTSGGSGPGNYEGFLDVLTCTSIQGWIWDRNRVNTPITIEFLDGSTVIGSLDAGNFRQDLVNAGKGNGSHGYVFTVPGSLKDGKTHSISARVPGGDYNLKGSPKTLTCPGGGREGVADAELTSELTVSPNPSSGRVVISYRLAAQKAARLEIVDLLGRIMWQQTVVGNGQTQHETADLSQSGTGLHFVQLKTADQQLIKRLLINR
jgi:glucose/arabinose dehydrogenase/chitodextrinase